MKTLWESLLSPDGDYSMKRFMGINILYYTMIVYFYTVVVYGFTQWHQDFLKELYIGGLALMGLTALDKLIGIFKK